MKPKTKQRKTAVAAPEAPQKPPITLLEMEASGEVEILVENIPDGHIGLEKVWDTTRLTVKYRDATQPVFCREYDYLFEALDIVRDACRLFSIFTGDRRKMLAGETGALFFTDLLDLLSDKTHWRYDTRLKPNQKR